MRRWLRWATRILAVGLLIVPVATVYFAFAPLQDEAPHPFNQDRNAVWLEHKWLEKEQAQAEMEVLLLALSRHGIAYVYPHLIPFNNAGRLPVHSREQMRRFLASARRVSPGLKVLPWVGGLRVGYKRSRPGTVDLADLGQRQRMVAECRGLIDEGFDGVHLNVEPVDDGNLDFLALLRALRTAVHPGLLSVSAIRPGPFRVPVAPNFFWTPGYYVRVAESADQVVVMAYDTALPTRSLYQRYLAYVARTLTPRFAASHTRARLLVGVPTYDETGFMHRAGVETPGNALTGLVAGLRGVGGGGAFEGVALYAEWTTSPAEWAEYERVWRVREDER